MWKVHGLLATETKPGRKEKINTHCSKEQVQEPVTALGGTRARGMQAHVSGLLAHSMAGEQRSALGGLGACMSWHLSTRGRLSGDPPRAPALDQATARSTASTAAPSTLREPGDRPQFVLFIPAKPKHPERSFHQGEGNWISSRRKICLNPALLRRLSTCPSEQPGETKRGPSPREHQAVRAEGLREAAAASFRAC